MIDSVGLELRRRPMLLVWQETFTAESNWAIGPINILRQNGAHPFAAGIAVNVEG